MSTNQEKLVNDVVALVRARNPIILIQTVEEKRVERATTEPLMTLKNTRGEPAGYDVRFWDCDNGVTNATGDAVDGGKGMIDISDVLGAIRDSDKRQVWFLRDAVRPWFDMPNVRRRLRNLARALPSAKGAQARTIILLSPSADLPPDLVDHVSVVKWKLPDREEISRILDTAINGVQPELRDKVLVPGDRDAAIDAAIGLTAEAAQSTYSQSLVTQGWRIVPAFVADEKKRIVNTKGIEVYDADPRGLDAIGGLEPLKAWLSTRRLGFSQEAREWGVPTPKGFLLVGVPGCGKSLTAKAVAAAFAAPLVRIDAGAAQSKWVGESQANFRNVFNVIDALGKCVVWIDEIEKMLAGATQGAADGGVSADQLGVLLTWMQERTGQSFVIATANDVSKLPPELLRKGRWDDLFFVDLPTKRERYEILKVVLKKYKRPITGLNFDHIVNATRDFTGAEIDALMSDVLFKAFADGKRALCTEDFVEAAGRTVPLARTAADKIKTLREWASGKARNASLTEESTVREGRNLDD